MDKDLEERKLALQKELAEKQIQVQMTVQVMAWAIDFSKLTMQSLLAINGGATVALLAFIPHIATADYSDIDLGDLTAALRRFAGGAFAGVTTAAVAYVSQYAYARSYTFEAGKFSIIRWRAMLGHAFFGVAFLSGLASLVLFGLGVANAVKAFSAL